LLTLVLLGTAAAHAQTTNGMTDAEIQGRQLAQQLCDAKPETNFVQSGVLNIRHPNGDKTNFQVSFQTEVTDQDWKAAYLEGTNCWIIIHKTGQPNQYDFTGRIPEKNPQRRLSILLHLDANATAVPFANSDFWLCDLGLEFFHWPQQKLLPKKTTVKRGRDYTLLESTNPNPPTNGYSRVVTWIDKDSGGILEAEAYDAQGKLLKEFEPKSFKKVNGQWELQEMEIRNVQTGSRTRLEFDLKP